VADSYDLLGHIAHREGKLEEAHRLAQKALAIKSKAFAPGDRRLGLTYELDAGHLLALGRPADARASVEQALAIAAKTVGADHPDYGNGLLARGKIFAASGRVRDAIPDFERAIAIVEKASGSQTRALHAPLVGLADARLAIGDARGALSAADRAVALDAQAPPSDQEAAQFRQAEARWALGEDRPQAIALARAVRAKLASLSFPAEDLLTIDRWLATHR
jgi:tetratricopeptide (TPR) repeat protein